MEPIAYQLDQVSVTYGSGRSQVGALKGVSTQIRRGQLVALAGPSGSGKSTLLNVLGCLASPSSGSVFFDGRDLTQLSESQRTQFRRRELGFVFQEPMLIPSLTAAENVRLGCRHAAIEGHRSDHIHSRLLDLDVADQAHRRPAELSIGEQQRVSIARAVAKSPTCILADEPTSSLDRENTDRVMEIFTSLVQRGTTVIFCSHDPVALGYAEVSLQLRDGELVKDTAHAA